MLHGVKKQGESLCDSPQDSRVEGLKSSPSLLGMAVPSQVLP